MYTTSTEQVAEDPLHGKQRRCSALLRYETQLLLGSVKSLNSTLGRLATAYSDTLTVGIQ